MTQTTLSGRWGQFARWLRAECGINDMRNITPACVHAYADERLQDGLAQSTVGNDVSAANVVLNHATRGHWPTLSPSAIAGPRDTVRREAPASLAADADRAARAALVAEPRAAVLYSLCRGSGMRSREASLADLDRLAREADLWGAVNIQEGAKGGRTAPRWVPLTEHGHAALAAALAARPAGSYNLLHPDETYRQWCNQELRRGRHALHAVGIRGYHDARAAYACARYAQLVGHPAPAVIGERRAGKAADRAARWVIASELGHGRTDVTLSYVGRA
ncbi:putative integrase [Salinisphaera sp. LB1]|nr:putative integrase [Salinisphaera sp. LB1]